MNKLVPFKKFVNKKDTLLSNTSVVVDGKGTPLGFVFGRESFISFLEHIDGEFEKRAKSDRLAYDNPAGKLIDLIEEKLPINPDFAKDLKTSIAQAEKSGFISLEEIKKTLHV